MPYIDELLRDILDVSKTSDHDSPQNAGELNFVITKLVTRYINQVGLKYETLNAAIGCLECAKLELYRRIVATYEDKKCENNGDVFPIEWT